MRIVLGALLVGSVAAALHGAAFAQPASPPASAASASVPALAASRPATRSAAVRAAENAKEPGNQRPEERVIPQISVPLKGRSGAKAPALPASLPAGTVPGRVNEGAARCLAAGSPGERAECERALAASGPAGR